MIPPGATLCSLTSAILPVTAVATSFESVLKVILKGRVWAEKVICSNKRSKVKVKAQSYYKLKRR